MIRRLVPSAPVWVIALAVVGACAEDEPSLPCDVRQRACQRAVFAATKGERGQKNARLPAIRVITRKQLEDELRRDFAAYAQRTDEAEQIEARQDQLAQSLLGFMPPPAEKSADDAYIEQAVAGIAAYYSSYSKDITIISDQVGDEDSGTITLSHELVHALQDQREDLTQWRRQHVSSSDGLVASKSLTEGEATWLSYVVFGRAKYHRGLESIDPNATFGNLLERTLEDVDQSNGAPLLAAKELLPYPVGGSFVADVHVSEGVDALAQLYRTPPSTLREFAEATTLSLPESLACDVPPAPVDAQEVQYDTLSTDRIGLAGLLAFYVALENEAQASFNRTLDWRADKLAVYAPAGDPTKAAVAWRVRLASASSAETLAELARQSGLDARSSGEELLVVAASDPTLLASWQPHETCGAPEKSRFDDYRPLRPSLGDVLGIIR